MRVREPLSAFVSRATNTGKSEHRGIDARVPAISACLGIEPAQPLNDEWIKTPCRQKMISRSAGDDGVNERGPVALSKFRGIEARGRPRGPKLNQWAALNARKNFLFEEFENIAQIFLMW
jgi:hypothetical protein